MSRWHRVAVTTPFVAVTFAAIYVVSAWTGGRMSLDVWLTSGGMIAFTIVGGLIEIRRPGQVVGRICLAIGCLLIVTGLLTFGAVTLDARAGRLPPLGAALAVLGSTSFGILLLASGPLLVSRFPDGRSPGRLAGLLDVLLVLSSVVFLLTVFRPGPITTGTIEPVDNPLGLTGIPLISDRESPIGLLAYFLTLVLAGIGLIRRYLRGDPVVRAQIRWFGASIALSAGLMMLMLATTIFQVLAFVGDLAWTAFFLSLLLPPIAIAIAILRYRLYDIDRIVSNTIAYGLVTVVLFGLFAVVNLVLVAQVSLLVNNEGAVVAGSTLLLAALFNPLRTRVQRVIDRRFHRAHYDAERMVAEFAGRLRDELDLSTLATDLAVTTTVAVQPTSAGLWLRSHSSDRGTA